MAKIVFERMGRDPKERGVTVMVRGPDNKMKCLTVHGYHYKLIFALIKHFLERQIYKEPPEISS